MDPDECWRQMKTAPTKNERQDHARTLLAWFDHGGFLPAGFTNSDLRDAQRTAR